MHFAAIDIGTNSVRLLVTDEHGRELARPMRITRLGQGVDDTKMLAAKAIERTLEVLREYKQIMDGHAVQKLRATASSAARDAENSREFLDAATHVLGTAPELISGEEEARLSFRGATSGLGPERAPFLVIDVGGGSTELAFGTSEPEELLTLQLGCVRMTERYLKSDPPTLTELEACRAHIKGLLGGVAGRLGTARARTFVGLAGTVTALAGMQLGLERYDASRTHHSLLSRREVAELFDKLSRATVAERRQLLAEPARADVIVGGAAVLSTLLDELEIQELLVSEHDILDGLIASLLRP